MTTHPITRWFATRIDPEREARGPPPRHLAAFLGWALEGCWTVIAIAAVLFALGGIFEAVVMLLLVASLSWTFLRAPSHRFEEGRASVAVFPFRNLVSSNAELDWMSTAIAEMLTTDLASGSDLRLIPGESVARIQREIPGLESPTTLEPETLEKVRKNLGADFVIVGSFIEQGDVLRLSASIQDARAGETVLSVAKNGEELFDLISKASQDIRLELGLERRSEEQAAQVRAAKRD